MSAANHSPTCWMIAGPNGAGKTTFALEYLPNAVGCRRFVNADLIAAGMAPLAPETERVAAGRIFLNEIERHFGTRRDFGFETTLAGRAYLRLIRRLRANGWRVAHGGHDIPDADIERRFHRSLSNLFGHYAAAVDRTVCFFNAGRLPEKVFTQRGEDREVLKPALFGAMMALTS